jgi:single-stranded-DNA-specific exonuclease
LSLPVAELLRASGPWGQGFPEPVFDGCFDVVSQRVVGEKHLKLTLHAPHHAKALEAIAFNSVREGEAVTYSRIRTAYKLDVNEYQGYRSLQLIIEHLESADTAVSHVEPATAS